MAKKFSHKTVVGTLRDIINEGEELSKSGNVQVAGEGRRSALLGTILLQLVSGHSEDDFNSIKLANYKKAEVDKANAEPVEDDEATKENDK